MPTPEEEARQIIDEKLVAAGWLVQDRKQINLGAGLGVAIREYPMTSGPTDYLLVVDRKAVGVIEAKPIGDTLSGVAEQSDKYVKGVPEDIIAIQDPLPFAYESTGVETLFRDLRDPDTRSRLVFSFHRPETLLDWAEQEDTLRTRLTRLPNLVTDGLRDCQIEAVANLEKSFAANRPRALIQMATGSGKTFTAITFIYRLIKHADAKRVLFLVDRKNLGKQAFSEFSQYRTPDDGRLFTELYNVQHLKSNKLDTVSRVCITTVQRLYSMLSGEADLDESLEEQSFYDTFGASAPPKEVAYNPQFPIEYFDFIVTDECHRSIYNLWRQVLEYYDSFLIGLTATPSRQTFGFFNQNLVMEYPHERAVADGVNVGYDVYRIKTKVTESGAVVEAKNYVDRRDRRTRKVRWEQIDEDLQYSNRDLDRSVVAVDQIRTVVREFRDRLYTDIFPGRKDVPKTLVFAKDDSHAEDIVNIMREEFGKGNDFCKKITYRTTGEDPATIETSFRNSYNPRIAVSVDMLSTGTDIKPLECLLFMRDVKSQIYFEQMKGRGTRVITQTDLQAVTPDTDCKTHFMIVDAVGVCETDKTDMRPLDRKPSANFKQVLNRVVMGHRDPNTLSTVASRLARLSRTLSDEEHKEIEAVNGNVPLNTVINNLLDAIDPDVQQKTAQVMLETAEPTNEQVKKAAKQLAEKATLIFDKPEFRNKLLEIKERSEQTIDKITKDEVLFSGSDEQALEKARGVVQSFKQFMEEHKDELTALQIFYSVPYGQRQLSYEAVKQLAEAISRPPYSLSTAKIWHAYEKLEQAKVRHMGPQRLLTNIVSLVRFALGTANELEPFDLTVDRRFEHWLTEQKAAGRNFTAEQLDWLNMIKAHIAGNVHMEVEDFDLVPFNQRGGVVKAVQVLGKDLEQLLDEMNEVLAA